MSITEILKPVDNFFINIDQTKGTLLIILALLSVYMVQFNETVITNTVNLVDNNLFKIIIFVIITYISSSSPAIGISLTIIMLVSLQIITNLKLRKDLQSEKFSQINPIDMSNHGNEYLTNPLEMQKELGPQLDMDLRFQTPDEYYTQMIKKGSILLEDSLNLEKDITKRFDNREQEIAASIKKSAIDLIDSGIGRLQKSDNGEYNINQNIQNPKFVKYSKLFENIDDDSDPNIIFAYNVLLENYNKLVSSQLNQDSFDLQLQKIYLSELELLESIYKIKKNKISKNKQKIIENEINNIKKMKSENKDQIVNLELLIKLIE